MEPAPSAIRPVKVKKNRKFALASRKRVYARMRRAKASGQCKPPIESENAETLGQRDEPDHSGNQQREEHRGGT